MIQRSILTISLLGWLWFLDLHGIATLAAEPQVLLEDAELELIAAEPEIVTPISMAFDSEGRLLVIESHTHQRPEDYAGPKGDRIRMLSDSNGDGKLDKWTTYAKGLQQAMNICVAAPGEVYVVTRREVVLYKDTDGDGLADDSESVLYLLTDAEYPHNGLSGICLYKNQEGQEKLLVGLGENFGKQYTLLGTDGLEVRGKGGAGTIFECSPDGKNLRRFAKGFWNPFAITAYPGKLVFAVDNDPDASPPCRLIHVVESGDYGHRFEYSRAGTHPLQAWNGELPGTLPMVCGTGESPCAVVPHRGYLWVTSWGDHRVERYRLVPRGASFTANREVVVQGNADFRPTGLAIAPDGSIYFSDWVDRSYPVHQKGRIWRIRLPQEKEAAQLEQTPKRRRALAVPSSSEEFLELVSDEDPFVRQVAVKNWRQLRQFWEPSVAQQNAQARLVKLQGLRWDRDPERDDYEILESALKDSSLEVRMYALRWIADLQSEEFGDQIAGLLDEEISEKQYLLSVLGALDWLRKGPHLRKSTFADDLLVRELREGRRSQQLEAFALRLISPSHRFLTQDRLQEYARSDFEPLRLEAVRTLALQDNQERFEFLAEILLNASNSHPIRLEAMAGLVVDRDKQKLLQKLAAGEDTVLANEAKRFLHLASGKSGATEQLPSPTDLESWDRLLDGVGDPQAGRRLFFAQVGPRCGACHRFDGRGGGIGPDLTDIARSNSRQQILASILNPSQDIAPNYQAWNLTTHGGKSYVGLRLPKAGDNGKEKYADINGKTFELASQEIEHREASDTSIMPSGLEEMLSVEGWRDLLAFLESN